MSNAISATVLSESTKDSSISIFENAEFGSIRTIEENGRILFCGSDIAKALGYERPNDTINYHCRYTVKRSIPRPQSKLKMIDMSFISEDDVYRLVTHSRLPSAQKFKSWVFDEVLPSIRKTDGSRLKLLELVDDNLAVQEDKSFVFNLADVDCFEEDNKLWFKLSDIGKILNLSGSTVRKMKYDGWFDNDEINSVTKSNGGSDVTYVSESALYRILNRSNSPKAKPFERWVTKEVIPNIRKTGKYETKELIKNEALERQLNITAANIWLRIADNYNGKSRDYKEICNAYAAKELAGKFVLPLPETDKTYSATEVGEMLGISANRVGKIANDNNLKIEEYGHWVSDKSKYSSKEVSSFRYNKKGVEKISELIKFEK